MNRLTAWLGAAAVALLGSFSTVAHAAEPTKEGIEFFETKIRPVLAESCYQCHSVEAKNNKKLKSKFYADSMEGLTKGGDTGNPGIVPGDPEKSSLIKSIRYEYKDDDDTMNMPPKKGDKGGKLPDEVIKNFEKWVKMGAPAPAEFQKPKEAKADASSGTSPEATATDPKAPSAKAHWAFGPPALSAVPAVKNTAWAKTEIDRFVLAKLEAKGLQPAAQADRRTLIRRATFGLSGLPPTPEEVEAFVADQSPNAYEKLIDRLLADPRYGERWARHWLDVARYSDTKGYVFQEERRYPYAYTYRDYVIQAFNNDKPYDRFLIEQIAADKLNLGDDKSSLAAMGFLTVGRRFLNRQEDIIDDRIDVVTRGTMGLTVACARCHDHKFEPIPTRDYYSLYGVFASSVEPDVLPLISDAKGSPEFEKELAKRQAAVEAYLVGLRDELAAKARTPKGFAAYLLATLASPDRRGGSDNPDINRAMLSRLRAELSAAAQKKDQIFAAWRMYAAVKPDEFTAKAQIVTDRIAKASDIHPLVKVAFKESPKSLNDVAERYSELLAKFDKPEPLKNADEEALRQVLRGEQSLLAVPTNELERGLRRDQRNKHRDLQKKVEQLQATSPDAPPRAMVMNDGNPHDVPIFIRGNSGNRGVIAPRQFLEILSGPERKKFTNGSGRLELAEAIASKSNPLTARVMVNRVWTWHFGTGIVTTPSDFGLRSDPPSHRELLDWMAVTFMNDGWSVKQLQKRIMMSAVYQQSSADNPAARAIDPENRLLWRQNRKRLEFEAIRDGMLAVSGQLHQSPFGRPVDINRPEENRRTIYGFIDRQNLPSMFRSFDFASPDMHTPMRLGTTVPQQALFFLNSPFAQRQAKMMVQRQDVKSRAALPEKVTRIYQLLYGRSPTPDELAMAQQFLDSEPAAPGQPAVARPIWSYGYGKFDEATKKVTFTPLPFYSKQRGWSGSAKLPDAKLGFVYLQAKAGHPDGPDKAAIRRWTASAAGAVDISGELAHGNDSGDGVRGRVVSSRSGVVGEWIVRNGKTQTSLKAVPVEAGDTLDFIVDCRTEHTSDGFQWAPALVLSGPQVPGTSQQFDAEKEFSGSRESPAPVERLSSWEKYVQVLMSSNEFVFVE